MKFDKVCIVGVGLLGGSIARDIRAGNLANRIVGVSRSRQSALTALEMGVVDDTQPLEQAVMDADLCIFATPMQSIQPLLTSVVERIDSQTTITDVGSVKGSLYEEIKRECSGVLPQCVFAHPIAGGEHSGVDASKEKLFLAKHIVITPTDEVLPEHLQKVEFLWEKLGGNIIKMDVYQHDTIFANTSHLPHVVAFALINYLSKQTKPEQLFELAASGFYDFTRIASSDARMWRDICMTNTSSIVHALKAYQAELANIANAIEEQGQSAVLEYFAGAKIARDTGLKKNRQIEES